MIPIIAHDINDAVRKISSLLLSEGNKYISGPESINANKPILEITDQIIEIKNIRNRIFRTQVDNYYFNPGLAAARVLYFFSGSNKLAPIEFYTKSAKQHSSDSKTLNGFAYGYHVFNTKNNINCFQQSLDNILNRPNTKKAYISLNGFDGPGHNIRSCAIGIAFFPRNGKLDIKLIMRANDAIKLLPYNFFEFSILGECMAAASGYILGSYKHYALSLHARDMGIDFAKALCDEASPETQQLASISEFSEAVRSKICHIDFVIRTDRPDANLILKYTSILELIWQDLFLTAHFEALRVAGMAGLILMNNIDALLRSQPQLILLNEYRYFLLRCLNEKNTKKN